MGPITKQKFNAGVTFTQYLSGNIKFHGAASPSRNHATV
jgi:hypothetical protein